MTDELIVPGSLIRNFSAKDAQGVADDGVQVIEHMCDHLGLPDLSKSSVLDLGCGTRFTQAIINRGLLVGSYTGVDVSPAVIDFLQSNVADARFEFHHLNAWNDLYNRSGAPLAEVTVPEIEGRAFDVICLFSVFTHLAPEDYRAMLRLVRRYAGPQTRLFYTLFVNELTVGGHGALDQVTLLITGKPATPAEVARWNAGRTAPDYAEGEPDRPLMVSTYSRTHALDLIEETGWRPLTLSSPVPLIQHHIVCEPVGFD